MINMVVSLRIKKKTKVLMKSCVVHGQNEYNHEN